MDTLPRFSDIQVDAIEATLQALLTRNRQAIAQILEDHTDFTWENLMEPLEYLDDGLHNYWSMVAHLNAVKNTPELSTVYAVCLDHLSAYTAWVSQNKPLYRAVLSLSESAFYHSLTQAQKKTIENTLRDFRLSGVHLDVASGATYTRLQTELSQLMTTYDQNLLDATQAWSYHVTDVQELLGLPESALDSARARAQAKHQDGWLLSLDMPCYQAVITFAQNRDLRKTIHQAYACRATQNEPIIQSILNKRMQLAQLLGFEHFFALSLETKMANSTHEVSSFLEYLRIHALPQAHKEWMALVQHAKVADGCDQVQPWDIPYYTERLKKERHDLDQEQIRHYFPIDTVLSGAFDLIHRLYGVRCVMEKAQHVWDPSVRLFSIRDDQGHLRGYCYLDLYARSGKRGGAWMDVCQDRRSTKAGTIQLPIAHIVCNFSAPVGDKPSLLTHNELLTLLHELGHGLHHLLTQVDVASVSGIHGVPWDAVELPSQFMEHWGWQFSVLQSMSAALGTGASLPKALFDRMQKAQFFQSALLLMKQLEYGIFDVLLHTQTQAASALSARCLLKQVREKTAVGPIAEYDRFECGFSHVFAGGYAAGYYSYLWAELLAFDAFARFEEEGIWNPVVAKDFLEQIMSQGGSEDFMVLFQRFRGSAPHPSSLLKHLGIPS